MRNALISKIAESYSSRPGYIYRSGSQFESGLARPNSLSVVFSIDWPKIRGEPVATSEIRNDSRLLATIITIQRAKDFLERHMLEELHIWDIKPGCIRVRYLLPDNVSAENVREAISALLAVRDSFDVMAASAHVNGKAV